MTLWRMCGGLLAVGVLTISGLLVPVVAQDGKDKDKKETGKEVKLVFKAFDADAKPFYQTLYTETHQTMKVMNQEVKQDQEQTFYIEWTPQKKEGDNLVVEQKIIGVKMKITIGGNIINYDSTDAKQPANPMTDFFEALKSLKLTLHIDPAKMTVSKIVGREDFVKKLGETNPQMTSLLENILSESAIKQMAQPTWGAVPTMPVSVGSTWESDATLSLGAIGTYKTKFKYTYDGEDKKLDKISVSSSLVYEVPEDSGSGKQLPFTIKAGTSLKSTEGSGTVYFDRAKGRIDNSKMSMKLDGTLVIDVGGMETSVSLVQEQSSTMTASDDNPIAAKKK